MSRSSLWQEVKNLNLQNRTNGYGSSSVASLRQVLANYGRELRAPLLSGISQFAFKKINPITGKPLTEHSEQLYKQLGYISKGRTLAYPSKLHTKRPIETEQGRTVWTLTKRELKDQSALIVYRVGNNQFTEAISLHHKDAINNAVNQILYSNDEATIEKVYLFKKEISDYRLIGPAYRNGTGNCVISALEAQLHKKLPNLHEQYERGVFQTDYDDIAKALGIRLRLDIAGELQVFGGARKTKIYDLMYLNNHCIARPTKDKQIIRHEYLDLPSILNGKMHLLQSIIVVGGEPICIQLADEQHQLSAQYFANGDSMDRVAIQSSALTAVSEYKHLVIEKNNLRSINWGIQYASLFARNGLKIVGDYQRGQTIDLKNAYTNYHEWPCYVGIPFDITYWCANTDQETILNNYLGFGLVSNWKNYFTKQIEQRWAFIPHIKSRLNKGENLTITHWALAFAKGDLDRSMFKGTPKRLWHRVLGSKARTSSCDVITTTDPIQAESLGGYPWKEINGTTIYQCTLPPKFCKSYVHVPAAIHAYTEIMLEDMYDRLQAENIDCWAVYGDGISTCSPDLRKFADKHWSVKDNHNRLCASESITDSPSKKRLVHHVKDASYTTPAECNETFAPFSHVPVSGKMQYKIIDGPSGSGKSTMLKAISKMVPDALILVPNNRQRLIYEGYQCQTIDMYLTNLTHGKGGRQFVFIDEYTMLDPSKLNLFESALLVGNVDQLTIGDYLDYKQFDHHLLTRVHRYDPQLKEAAELAKVGRSNQFQKMDIETALKKGIVVLAATNGLIETINQIGLKLDLPKRIRFNHTDHKSNIWKGDTGLFENGRCFNERTGKWHKMIPGHNHQVDKVLYAFAWTYHMTQGSEFPQIVCCVDGLNTLKDHKMLYVGSTRVKRYEDAFITSLRW